MTSRVDPHDLEALCLDWRLGSLAEALVALAMLDLGGLCPPLPGRA